MLGIRKENRTVEKFIFLFLGLKTNRYKHSPRYEYNLFTRCTKYLQEHQEHQHWIKISKKIHNIKQRKKKNTRPKEHFKM